MFVVCIVGLAGYSLAKIELLNDSVACVENNDLQEETIVESTTENQIHGQNDANKVFYGTWEYTSVISQHAQLGGDEGYEGLLGKKVIYAQDFFQCEGCSPIDNPNYLITIVGFIVVNGDLNNGGNCNNRYNNRYNSRYSNNQSSHYVGNRERFKEAYGTYSSYNSGKCCGHGWKTTMSKVYYLYDGHGSVERVHGKEVPVSLSTIRMAT